MMRRGVELRNALWLGWVIGLEDFKRLGVGTRAGRLWPTISVAIRVIFIGLIFGLVFQSPITSYLPWLASGFITWSAISASINSGSTAFNSAKSLMLAIPIPKEAFVFRVLVREGFLFLQNLVVMAGVLVAFQIWPSTSLLLLVPGMLITGLFLAGLSMTIGPLVSRFKDLGQFISAIINVMFFVLPIMWRPEDIQSELANLILGLNPLYHYVQIIRLPLLSQVPTNVNYLLAIGGAIGLISIGWIVMRKTRERLVYWV